jgi:hypothetical protein
MRAGEAENVAEIVDQQQPGLDLGLIRLSVHPNLDFGGHVASRTCIGFQLGKAE